MLKLKKVKATDLDKFTQGDAEHKGTWDVMDGNVCVGRIVKRVYLKGICTGDRNYITRYVKETSWRLSFKEGRGMTLFGAYTMAWALEQWSFFKANADRRF